MKKNDKPKLYTGDGPIRERLERAADRVHRSVAEPYSLTRDAMGRREHDAEERFRERCESVVAWFQTNWPSWM